ALRAFHVSPARPTIAGSPGAELAAVGVATTAVVIPKNGLRLSINVIGVTRRHCDVDASKLVTATTTWTGSGPTAYRIVTRGPSTGVHRRTCRVRAADHLITKHEPISIAGN